MEYTGKKLTEEDLDKMLEELEEYHPPKREIVLYLHSQKHYEIFHKAMLDKAKKLNHLHKNYKDE